MHLTKAEETNSQSYEKFLAKRESRVRFVTNFNFDVNSCAN